MLAVVAERCPACSAELDGLERCTRCGLAARVKGYEVRSLLSQRAHSRVYRGADAQGREVAIKELLFTLVPDRHTLDAFEREAAILRGLRHPQVPRFVDSFSLGDGVHTRLYLVQEFIAGTSLASRFAAGPIDEPELVRLAAQVLTVLDHLHHRQPAIVHRDVKPQNLILPPVGPLHLVDFGSARGLARQETFQSTLVGTFGYMPPEQLGGTVDATSDLFALGATLLHGLTGREPETMLRDGVLEIPRGVHLSPARRWFLERLLAPARSRRFASAAEARRVLLAQPRRRRRWAVALAAAVIAIAAPVAWKMTHVEPPPPTKANVEAEMKREAMSNLRRLAFTEEYYYQERDSYSVSPDMLGWAPDDWCPDGARLELGRPNSVHERLGCHFRYRIEVVGQGLFGRWEGIATGGAGAAVGLEFRLGGGGTLRGVPISNGQISGP